MDEFLRSAYAKRLVNLAQVHLRTKTLFVELLCALIFFLISPLHTTVSCCSYWHEENGFMRTATGHWSVDPEKRFVALLRLTS